MAASDSKRKREDEQSDDAVEVEVELDAENQIAKRHKLPTGEELRTLKDAADLYQSSSFKLQIDALLPNVRPKESRRASLDQFLLALRSHLLSLPPIQPQNPLVAARALSENGVAVPFALPHPTKETKWTVAFEPPSDIHVVGSWANNISVKKRDGKYFGVDLSIEMPSSLFQEKDYLDARYFHKRSYYLAVVAQSISTSFQVDVFYGAASSDPRQTILVLRPRKGSSHDFSKTHTEVHIIPALSSSHPIPLHRLSPSHSNVRVQPSSEALFPITNPSTPIYNTAILLSIFPKISLLSVNTFIQSNPAFRDALTLLRVWANQRGYGEGALCVHGFEGKGSWWASVLGLLLDGEEPVPVLQKSKTGRRFVGKGLSSYQLFRASLDKLAKQDFDDVPAFVKSINGHKFSPGEYSSHHSAVFVDATSTINHLVDVPLTSLNMLQYDAQQTLEQLNDSTGTGDVFANVFLKDQTHLSKRCDAVIRVDLSHVSKPRSAFEFVEHGTSDSALLAGVSRILQRGLGNRVRAVAIFHPSSNVRSISEMSSFPRISVIYVGLIYSREDSFRLVDHGPPAEEQDSEAAKEFRKLWGPKSELRRFKDGRIVESVVWEVKTSDERAHVPASIVRHLLHLHFGIPIMDIQTIATPFDAKLRLPDHLASIHQHAGGTGGFKAALTVFDGLVRNLKALDDNLPLALLNVSPVSEYLRYTSTFSPLPIPQSSSLALPTPLRYLPQIPIVLEFEKSSKWPDDLHAIQKIKLAFLETIASALMTAYSGLRAAVHIEHPDDTDIQDHASLDILTPEGWSFSARIWHDREAVLLERLTSSFNTPLDPNPQPSKDQRMARRALDLYTRRFIHAPRHHRAIATLAHRHIAYPGTVRLVKRWLASHWLLGIHVSEEAVELICARPFVGTGVTLPDTAVSIPRSKERGFALVIEFLKDWKPENPLFVPLYEDSGPSTEPSVVAVGSKEGVWTISTSEDPGGKMWTSSGPDGVAAHRLCALAKEVYKILLEADIGPGSVKRLFSHGTDDYDIVIELDPTVLPRYHQNIDVDESAWSKSHGSHPSDGDAVSRPGFDPARMFVNDLQSTFSDTLKFFFDIYGGHCIGAIWLLNVSGTRPFRALGGFSSTPATQVKNSKGKDRRDTVLLNQQSVLDEIERLGMGLIKRITVREE